MDILATIKKRKDFRDAGEHIAFLESSITDRRTGIRLSMMSPQMQNLIAVCRPGILKSFHFHPCIMQYSGWSWIGDSPQHKDFHSIVTVNYYLDFTRAVVRVPGAVFTMRGPMSDGKTISNFLLTDMDKYDTIAYIVCIERTYEPGTMRNRVGIMDVWQGKKQLVSIPGNNATVFASMLSLTPREGF